MRLLLCFALASLACFALASLAACASPQKAASDNITVVWNRVDDTQRVCQALAGRKEIYAIRGCSKWSDSSSGRVCNIYAPKPRSEMDNQAFITLGHELLHCFDGNWHDRWGRMNPDERQAAVGGTRTRAN
jgi:hypothetical protein